MLLNLLKPLFILSESGDSWFHKYRECIVKKLKLLSTVGDMSFYYKHEDKSRQRTMVVYVDDTVPCVNKKVQEHTDAIPQRFMSKRWRKSNHFSSLEFIFTRNNMDSSLNTAYAEAINELPNKASCNDFRTNRHKPACLLHKRPEILAGVNILFEVIWYNYKVEYDIIIKLIKHIRKHHKDGLTFQKLYFYIMRILVYSDGSFSTSNDGPSHVCYQIIVEDSNNDANIIYFASAKSRRVVRYALGAEMFRLSYACETSINMKLDLRHTLR